MAHLVRWQKSLRTFALLTGACLMIAASPGGAVAETRPAGTTRVVISKVRSGQGSVFVAVYERSGWLVPGKFRTYRTVRAHTGEVSVSIPGLARGRYAAAVFHDENQNGVIDTNWLGLPKEGFGFSRLSPLRIPSFDEASFDAGAAVVPIQLRY